MRSTDLFIIGAGPIGISCAIEAKQRDLDFIIVDKGCLVNSLYNYPLGMQFFSSSDRLELDGIPFCSIAPKPNRNEALEYYRRVVDSKEIKPQLYEKVIGLDKDKDGTFIIETSKEYYKAKQVVIATGFFDLPNLMNVPGEELQKVTHYFKEAHPYSNQKVAVIGASNSAIDAALACYRKGAEVTLIIRGPEVGPRVKYWVRPDIINRIEEGSITAFFNTEVTAITTDQLIVTSEGKSQAIDNDFVIAMTGYLPDFEFLKMACIQLEGATLKPYYDPTTMETNIPGLYLAGVICGGLETHKWFIENSRDHAKKIVDHIMG